MEFPETITLPYIQDYKTPFGEEALDQFPSALPRFFIEHYSIKGARVFDPFMGFGTTAFMAEDLGRVPFGIEADEERHGWAAGQLAHWQNVVCCNAGDAEKFGFSDMDMCITSPPWMEKEDDWNPLYAGDPKHAGYDAYIARMTEIFAAVKTVMKKNAPLIVHVSDIGDTPLIDDFRREIIKSFTFISDITITWDADIPDTHCLAFKAY